MIRVAYNSAWVLFTHRREGASRWFFSFCVTVFFLCRRCTEKRSMDEASNACTEIDVRRARYKYAFFGLRHSSAFVLAHTPFFAAPYSNLMFLINTGAARTSCARSPNTRPRGNSVVPGVRDAPLKNKDPLPVCSAIRVSVV